MSFHVHDQASDMLCKLVLERRMTLRASSLSRPQLCRQLSVLPLEVIARSLRYMFHYHYGIFFYARSLGQVGIPFLAFCASRAPREHIFVLSIWAKGLLTCGPLRIQLSCAVRRCTLVAHVCPSRQFFESEG
eukprot:TRINITY_DN58795_c0_g1_i1.p1 TRINITY_DN58795_c0_g1~~TRINITY_DN58795_c0_g1_i1.p1  ORF type:complete len:132 (+),score=8.79 TRINITY_DN58795_c0_g1_i1:1-396(+)